MNDMPLKELFEVANPEHVEVIKEMAAKAAIPDTGNVGDLLEAYRLGSELFDSMTHQSKLAMLSVMTMNRDKFAAKLSFDQRCQILALHRIGIVREDLAKMYGVDRRTVGFIYNQHSSHYRNVRAEENKIGIHAFRDRYLTTEIINRALAYRQAKESNVETKNNKSASKRAGLHIVRGKMCTYDHRVTIAWRDDAEEGSGWYYRDLDSDFSDVWISAGDESMRTSDNCYKAMLNNIYDKL